MSALGSLRVDDATLKLCNLLMTIGVECALHLTQHRLSPVDRLKS